jgi:hypothetical protein
MSFHAWVDLVEGRMLIQKVSMCEFFRTISSADSTVTERERKEGKKLDNGENHPLALS